MSGEPHELQGDAKRQAVASIKGYVYQAWTSIEAWLRLTRNDQIIYLEGAEDFDVISSGGAIAVQVKHREAGISLASATALEVLQNFWATAALQPMLHVEMHLLTTSAVVVERDGDFRQLAGINAWTVARTNADIAKLLIDYLVTKLPKGPLTAFLGSSSIAEVQDALFRRFHWMTSQPGLDSLKRSVQDLVAVRLSEKGISVHLRDKVLIHLEARFWSLIVLRASSDRRLTLGDLLVQIEEATSVYMPVPMHLVPDLLGGQSFGEKLLALLLQKPSTPPQPLLPRRKLVQEIEKLVELRQAVLLGGTVHKGKTTLAQLVTVKLCPSAWWLKLSGRPAAQVDTLLLALAARVEGADCPFVVVIDDLDTSAEASRIYGDALQLVVHRLRSSGRALLITARGNQDGQSTDPATSSVQRLEVGEFDEEELASLCAEFGCPQERADAWSKSIAIWTRGHPKLVQVRIAELSNLEWPAPKASDFLEQSSAVTTAKQLSRQLLASSHPEPTREFLYMAAEMTMPMDMKLARLLADSVPGIGAAGDVIEGLVGQWLERYDGEMLRTTPLLKGAANDVWPLSQVRTMHRRLHDVIASKGTLNQSEAAALLFHAFMAQDRKRLAITSIRLQMADDRVQGAVFEQLSWLPIIALGQGQTFTEEPLADAAIRSLQFRVAAVLDEEKLDVIAERWIEVVRGIEDAERRETSEAMLWATVGTTDSASISIGLKLTAIAGMRSLESSAFAGPGAFRRVAKGEARIPQDSTPTQVMLVMMMRSVRNERSLNDLVDWLERTATPMFRQEFDAVLVWPLAQMLGAFVQGAWAASHEETEDWHPWIRVFDRILEFAVRFGASNFGREAAKAKAMILAEYLNQGTEALGVLSEAEGAFGPSSVLTEQRANVLFQNKDDAGVLSVWQDLQHLPDRAVALDPFAYRRIAMSAARLALHREAAQVFLEGAASIAPGEYGLTRFGLLVDAAIASSLARHHVDAANAFALAIGGLPADAWKDGNAQWEAAQRVATDACRQVAADHLRQNYSRRRIAPGDASSPELTTTSPESNQTLRTQILLLESLEFGAAMGVAVGPAEVILEELLTNSVPFVRFRAAQAKLGVHFRDGSAAGFVPALAAFDAAVEFMTANKETSFDAGVVGQTYAANMEKKWFGFLAVGLLLSKLPTSEVLRTWLQECRTVLPPAAGLGELLHTTLQTVDNPAFDWHATYRSTESSPLLRCAAARVGLGLVQTAEATAQLQWFLVSGCVCDGSYAFQELFNHHIAVLFAPAWLRHSAHPFNLVNPRHTAPRLQDAVSSIAQGSATLKDLLTAASEASSMPLGDWATRVW